jgi:hypothetical protein
MYMYKIPNPSVCVAWGDRQKPGYLIGGALDGAWWAEKATHFI